jgi:small GTP-binding protein
MNLDTLLIQTELIIVMWTLNDPESLNNAEKLIDIIKSGIKNNKFRNAPIFLIQNKTDLKLISSRASVNDEEILKKIEKIKSKYPNIYVNRLSLLEKKEDDYYELILEINRRINDNGNNNNEEIFDMVIYKYPFTDHKELKKNHTNINIALLGSSATGKTSFIYALENKPINNIQPTTVKDGIFHIISEIYNEKINITIIDTIGQERFRALASNTFKKADGFLIFFDVTNKATFNDIDYYFDEIQKYKETKAIILLGNKIDDNDNRAISKQKGKDKADEKGIKYFEISCLYGINIVEILNEIALMSYKNYKFQINENINKNNNDKNDNRNDINKNYEINNQNKIILSGDENKGQKNCYWNLNWNC